VSNKVNIKSVGHRFVESRATLTIMPPNYEATPCSYNARV